VTCTSPSLGPWDMPSTPTFNHSYIFDTSSTCTLTPGDSAIRLNTILTDELQDPTLSVPKTIGVSFE
jgi:hypothetical protein